VADDDATITTMGNVTTVSFGDGTAVTVSGAETLHFTDEDHQL
jgi:hypothetical protein